MENQCNKNRIVKNTIFLYIRMLIVIAIGLYTSRAVIQNLGVEDFGIYNLIGGVVIMFTFLNSVIGASTSRYITLSIGLDDNERIQKVFSVAQINHIGIALIILILSETIGLWLIYYHLSIPPERLDAAFWVMQFSILTCCFSIINAPLSNTIFAFEKMNAFAVITTIVAFLKLIAVFSLWWVTYDKLILYSAFLLFIGIVEWIINRVYCKITFKNLKFKWVKDKQLYKEMLQFSGWSLVNWGVFTCYTQGITILLNLFFGPTANAARGIAMQVYNNTYSFCNGFQSALNPQITKTYAVSDYDNMKSLIYISSKYCYILLFTILFSLWLSLDYVLELWLGIVPQNTASFIIAILLVALISTLNNPLETSINAYGKLRKIRIRNSFILILILPLSYLYLKYSKYQYPVMVFYIQLIFEFVVYISNLMYIHSIIHLDIRKYLFNVWLPLLKYNIAVVPIPLFFSFLFNEKTFLNITLIVIISLIVNGMSAYKFALNKKEQILVKRKICNLILKYRIFS